MLSREEIEEIKKQCGFLRWKPETVKMCETALALYDVLEAADKVVWGHSHGHDGDPLSWHRELQEALEKVRG